MKREPATLGGGAAGPGGPAGLQNRSAVVTRRWVGSTPTPLRPRIPVPAMPQNVRNLAPSSVDQQAVRCVLAECLNSYRAEHSFGDATFPT